MTGTVLTQYNGSSKTVTIPNEVTSIEAGAFWGNKSITSITLPDSVTSIGGLAFANCYKLSSITIGRGVTNIGDDAFYSCKSLNAINVDPRNTKFTSDNGVLYSKDKTTLIACPANKKGVFVIPNGVLEIWYYAFNYCSGLTEIIIPNGFQFINNHAFIYCSFKSITIPASTLVIQANAFWNMTNGYPSITFQGADTQVSGNNNIYDAYKAGGPGTYKVSSNDSTWIKQ